MPRLEKSIAMVIGTVFAAVYVLLLLGFTREFYAVKGPASLTVPAHDGRPVPHPVTSGCAADKREPCARPARAE